jgi:histidyl-tRNA synthetase
MKYADKLGAKYTIVIGDNEVDEGVAKLKDMKNGTETELAWQPL